jgi:hypothetical protein
LTRLLLAGLLCVRVLRQGRWDALALAVFSLKKQQQKNAVRAQNAEIAYKARACAMLLLFKLLLLLRAFKDAGGLAVRGL